MKHKPDTNQLSEIAYRVANGKDIKFETINSLTTEEKVALDVLLEKGSVDILCAEHETSPVKGIWWMV
ncbi:MAG: hypothetical protein U5K99_07505 [Anaerolineales bacterium]|nr:hypothetical protein [Anaerolineales bacterium]